MKRKNKEGLGAVVGGAGITFGLFMGLCAVFSALAGSQASSEEVWTQAGIGALVVSMVLVGGLLLSAKVSRMNSRNQKGRF